MVNFNGKVAVITGGASGIGEATVREMAAAGASVVIADVDGDKGGNLAANLRASGQSCIYQATDVSREPDVQALVERTVAEYGRLDIMVANAGVNAASPTHHLRIEAWRENLAVNLDGVFLSAKHAIRYMRLHGGGAIVITGSVLGHVGAPGGVLPYTGAKAAVANMARSLALEYAADNIRVNTVSPGYVMTPLLENLDAQAIERLVSLHPLGRLGKPSEVAKAIVFLASDDASFITGTSLLVDGGYTAR